VTGKLSFEINKVLNPEDVAPTLVATDMERLVVPDGAGLRRMTLREGLRLFGFPEWFEMPVSDKEGFDLLGNTVAVNVVQAISERVGEACHQAFTFSETPVCAA
jgi:Site-specific DNA methylase